MTHFAKLILVSVLCLSLLTASGCTEILDEITPPSEVNIGTTQASEVEISTDTTTEPTEPESTVSDEVTIEETVLYDANEIRITATALEESWLGQEITLLIENNSATNIMVTTDMLSINGFMSPLSSLYASVAAGKKAYESISLSSTNMEQAGITTISNIQFNLNISDSDTWSSLYTSDLITLNTSAKDTTQAIDDSGNIIYDNNGIRVICKGLKQDLLWDGSVVFLIENASGKNMYVYAENVSVNGFMCSASMWATVRSETVAIDDLTLINLDELNISSTDEISNVEFSLRFTSVDDIFDSAESDVISLNF